VTLVSNRFSLLASRAHSLLATLLIVGCGEGNVDPSTAYDTAGSTDSGRPEAEKTAEESSFEQDIPALPELLDPSNAPPGDVDKPDYVHSSGFFTLDGRLYDRYGNDFIPRGVNNAHAWFDTGGRFWALGALDNIANYGFNSIRIVWEDEPSLTPELLRRILRRAVELELIPMLEMHGATGSRDAEDLLAMAEYFTEEDVADVLLEFEDYLLLNIANEWSGADFYDGYEGAINLIRGAGLNHTLVIDGNEWGQNSEILFAEGPALLEADVEHNLLFSTHMYESYAGRRSILGTFERAAEERLPLVVGEFGHEHGGRQIDVGQILEQSSRLGFGHMGWSWTGNSTDVAHLDMTRDWEGEMLTDWGELLINGAFGIKETSQKASIFLIGTVDED
jgi:hypothetical protein